MTKNTALIFLVLTTSLAVGCTRNPQRSGQGDVNTETRTAPVQNGDLGQGPAADNVQGDEPIARDAAPANIKPSTGTATDLPHDEKGIVGSPYASNIDPSNKGKTQPQLPGSQQKAQSGTASSASGATSPLDVSQYDYSKKDDFKSLMSARIEAVDRGIESLKSTPASSRVQPLEREQEKLAERLKSVDNVPRANWDTFKQSFRDDVAKLEKNYQDVLSASR